MICYEVKERKVQERIYCMYHYGNEKNNIDIYTCLFFSQPFPVDTPQEYKKVVTQS